MVLGIGVDVTEIARFEPWLSHTQEQLESVYGPAELDEFERLRVSANTAPGKQRAQEWLAARFAAKEAFYKAFSNTLITTGSTMQHISFAQIRPYVQVERGEWDVPQLNVAWDCFEPRVPTGWYTHLSLSHERSVAIAMVVVSSKHKCRWRWWCTNW